MYYELPSKLILSVFLISVILISLLSYFLIFSDIGILLVLLLIGCFFLFSFWDNNAKRENLDRILKLRENPTKYLFSEIPKEFP